MIRPRASGRLEARDPFHQSLQALVGWRLAEWLPLDGDERQLLLQDEDADQRLQRLVEWIPRFQVA